MVFPFLVFYFSKIMALRKYMYGLPGPAIRQHFLDMIRDSLPMQCPHFKGSHDAFLANAYVSKASISFFAKEGNK